ncbi:MAG: hypothetical protein GY820_40960 [Gammaproteobacteria bacterium]|nr:hypothetical protein [Gammaproteobacteria bacterium]
MVHGTRIQGGPAFGWVPMMGAGLQNGRGELRVRGRGRPLRSPLASGEWPPPPPHGIRGV